MKVSIDEQALDKAAREGYAVRCKTHGPRVLAQYASPDIMQMQLDDARVIVSAYLDALSVPAEAVVGEPSDAHREAIDHINRLIVALKPFVEFSQNVEFDADLNTVVWSSRIHRDPLSTWFGPSDFAYARFAVGDTTERLPHIAAPSAPDGMREALEKIAAMRWHEDADLDDICTIADRALAAPSAPDGWQPIETAPKDGTKILLCLTGYQPVVGYFDGHRWDYQDREDFIEEDHWFAWQEQTGDWYPDHWMPIPAAPAIRSETP